MRMDCGYVEIKITERRRGEEKERNKKRKKRQKRNGTRKEEFADSQLGWMKVL